MGYVDVRGTQIWTGGGTANVALAADVNQNLLVSDGSPSGLETSRRGNGWTVTTVTALQPLAALPTTAAALELYNNVSTQGLSIRDLFAFQLLSTAATQTYSIWAMVTTTKAIPTLTALNLFSMSGKNLVTPTASGQIVTGVGTTVVANGWRPYGTVQSWGTAAALPGNGWNVPIDGRIVVPYGCSLCLHIIGTVGTASSFHVGCTFDIIEGYVQET